MRVFLSFIFFLSFLFQSFISASALTLSEAYEAAKIHTSRIKNQFLDEEISQSRQLKMESYVKPKVSLNAAQIWRENVRNSSNLVTENNSHSVALNLNQPLFQGGTEYFGLQAAKNYSQVTKWNRLDTEINLYNELAKIFYNILALKKESESLQSQEELIKQRIVYLQNRVKIGRSKKTELLTAKSQQAYLEAEIESVKEKILFNEKYLMTQTGLSTLTPVIDPLSDNWYEEEIQKKNQSSSAPLTHPKIQSSKYLMEQYQAEIKAVRGDYWPKIDFSGNYYFDRSGVLKNSHWDAGLNAKWEIYSGRSTESTEREKYLNLEKLKFEIKDLEHDQSILIENIQSSLIIKINQLKKTKLAVELAKENYQENIRESSSGLISDLEVLRSLDDYLQLKRSFDRLQYEPKILYFELKKARGISP